MEIKDHTVGAKEGETERKKGAKIRQTCIQREGGKINPSALRVKKPL